MNQPAKLWHVIAIVASAACQNAIMHHCWNTAMIMALAMATSLYWWKDQE